MLRIMSAVSVLCSIVTVSFAQGWQLKSQTGPGGDATILNHTMVYDTNIHKTIIFGSAGAWIWDGSNWTLNPSMAFPGNPADMKAVFDRTRDCVVAFHEITGAVWEFDESWDLRWNFGFAPSSITLAYDNIRSQCAALRVHGSYRELLIWDGETGSMNAVDDLPSGNYYESSWCFDPTADRFVLHGGRGLPVIYGDTWHWMRINDKWTRLQGNGPKRKNPLLIWHEAKSRMMLFGGFTASDGANPASFATDTWVLVNNHWTRIIDNILPQSNDISESESINIIYDNDRATLVLLLRGNTYELPTPSIPALPCLLAFDSETFSLRRAASTRFNITASPDTEIARITLFRDSNFNGVWDPSDVSVGNARRGRDGQWSASVNSRSWPSGDVRIHAVAFEQFTDSPFSISTDVRVLNSVPVIAKVLPSARRISAPGAPLTLSAVRALDPDGVVTRVEYFLDKDRSGHFNSGDVALGSATPPGVRFNVATAAFTRGFNDVIATAVDAENARSLPFRLRIFVD